jgi:hypothetical protein
MPPMVATVWMSVSATTKWKPYVVMTALLAKTMPDADTMLSRAYNAGRRLDPGASDMVVGLGWAGGCRWDGG